MRIVAISDTHNMHDKIKLPDGDILLHTGDITMDGYPFELVKFADWLHNTPHKYKIIVAGNHDFVFQEKPQYARSLIERSNTFYLCDEEAVVGGLRIYGSPWTPKFFDWAFMKPRETIGYVWENIPYGLDVLATHGPPMGKLDKTRDGLPVGCYSLREEVMKKKPRIHVFGHIHEGYGMTEDSNTRYYNVSVCNRRFKPVNTPTVIDL